jgi:OH-DDVA oxygenase
MAEIVLGIGTSHGPLLSTPPELWNLRAQADRENRSHYFRGRVYDYESLVRERAPGFSAYLPPEARRERHARCQTALDALSARLKAVAPDALVIVGNDQRELFSEELTPSIAVYRGGQIENIPYTKPETSPGLAIAEKGNCPPGGATYPGAPELADCIVGRSSSRDSTRRSRRFCRATERGRESPTRSDFSTTGSRAMRRRPACRSFSTSTIR